MKNLIVIEEDELRQILAEEVGKVSRADAVSKLKRPWLTRKEAIDYLPFGGSKLDQLAKDGFLPKHYISGLPVFYLSDLDALPQGGSELSAA